MAEGKFKHARAINKAHVAFFRNLKSLLRKTKGVNYQAFNKNGLYRRSIVWDYFAGKKRKFSELDTKNLHEQKLTNEG